MYSQSLSPRQSKKRKAESAQDGGKKVKRSKMGSKANNKRPKMGSKTNYKRTRYFNNEL